jgi:hypothetical protein
MVTKTGISLILSAVMVAVTGCKQELRTEISIQGDRFLINGKPTYEGRYWNGNKVEGLLLNARLVQGVFDDENPETRPTFVYPDTGEWSADRNTNEFVAAMPSWKAHGLNSFTLNLQGGSPTGYGNKSWINSAFDANGDLKPAYMDRLKRILNKADELQMIVILGYFYFGQDQVLKDEAAVKAGVTNITTWILTNGFRNVLVEINNECNSGAYDHPILREDRVHELITLAQGIEVNGDRLLVSTSYGGCYVPHSNVVSVADYILIHGNDASENRLEEERTGIKTPSPVYMQRLFDETRKVTGYRGQPIVVNEDDHYGYDQPDNNYKRSIENYVSWGYFDFRRIGSRAEREGLEEETDIEIGYQSVPVDWSISHSRKEAFFNYTKEISGY